MAEVERKKQYEIKDEVWNILLSIDDKSAEGRVIREAQNGYLRTLRNIDQYDRDLTSILDLLETESARTKSLHGKLALNEKEIAAMKCEIPLLKKEWKAIENPERVLEEYERQELLLADLAEQETASGKDIAQTEYQVREDLKTADTAAEELKTIIPEIEQKTPQKTALIEEVRRLEITAKIFVKRERLKSALKENEDELTVSMDALNTFEETISECNESIPELKDAIATLTDRIGPLEEAARDVAELLEKRKAFKSDIEAIETEHAAINLNVDKIQVELDNVTGSLAALEQGNSEMKESIASIEETVDRNSDTLMEIKAEKGKLEKSTTLYEKTIEELEGQLNDKKTMDNELSTMDWTMKTILGSIKAKI